jgi:DNA-binding NarL/FixJ family response regulator
MLRVLIVDDHPLFRQGVSKILRDEPDIGLIGQAADGQQALQIALQVDWDVVLLDISLPQVNGLVVLRSLKQRRPTTPIIMLTVYQNRHYLHDALNAGAAGYMSKEATSEELLAAIRSVLVGKTYINENLRSLV